MNRIHKWATHSEQKLDESIETVTKVMVAAERRLGQKQEKVIQLVRKCQLNKHLLRDAFIQRELAQFDAAVRNEQSLIQDLRRKILLMQNDKTTTTRHAVDAQTAITRNRIAKTLPSGAMEHGFRLNEETQNIMSGAKQLSDELAVQAADELATHPEDSLSLQGDTVEEQALAIFNQYSQQEAEDKLYSTLHAPVTKPSPHVILDESDLQLEEFDNDDLDDLVDNKDTRSPPPPSSANALLVPLSQQKTKSKKFHQQRALEEVYDMS